MRKEYVEQMPRDKNLQYRGKENTRLNSLTDAVFSIALALLIFNITDADSFKDLMAFAKSFPALLVSIIFLYLVWKEHVSFTELYHIKGFVLQLLNVIFIALVIFYVYPLRFLTRLLTSMLFNLNIELVIESSEVPQLMIFYGAVAFSIYFIMFLFYLTIIKQKQQHGFTEYELLHTKSHGMRVLIMSAIPLLSLTLSYFIQGTSIMWASIIGGCTYGLYPILIQLWRGRFERNRAALLNKEVSL